jgi:hypothetical protein
MLCQVYQVRELIRSSSKSSERPSKTPTRRKTTFSRFEKIESMDSNQLGVRWPIVVEDNASEVWRSSDGGDFAQSQALRSIRTLTVTHTRVYKAAEFTADIRQMDAQPEKVTPIIAGAVARANQRLKKSCNQFVFGDGSGEVARYSSGTGTTTITFTSTSGNFFGSSKIMKNGRYQWYDSTLATARNSGYVFTVQSVDVPISRPSLMSPRPFQPAMSWSPKVRSRRCSTASAT